jgi:hypothetical protein
MSVRLVCDVCHDPKEFVEHYTLTRQERDKDDPKRRWRKHFGTIDLCGDCLTKVAHDGRSSSHKVATIQFGRTSR